MDTPYYLILQDELDKNIAGFQNALTRIWPNSKLTYSVKTNSLPWLLRYLHKRQVYAEVVSDEEYQLVQLCGFQKNEIVYNGPIKGERQFAIAAQGGSILNLDSASDLVYMKRFPAKSSSCIGIRVNIDPEAFVPQDIGYAEDGFRFGFAVGNGSFEKALRSVRDVYGVGKIGLHLHCNSVTRSIGVYKSIAEFAAKLIRKYQLDVSFIDIGGGFFGGVPGKPTPEAYLLEIRNALLDVTDPEKTTLILEPGSAIIGSAVELHTSVLDIKDTDHARIVTTDGSRIHIDPLWAKKRYMFSVQKNGEYNNSIFPKQVICGYTCMDHDRLMVIEDQPELEVGDKIVYHRVGAYSMTFGGMFIRYLPDVYVKSENYVEQVRSRISVEEYFKIHS